MADNIKEFYEKKAVPLFNIVEEVLNLHNFEIIPYVQVPKLLSDMALKLDWTDADIQSYNGVVRWYLRSHQKYMITKGAKGGIILRAAREAKLAAQNAKDIEKEKMRKAIEEAAEMQKNLINNI